MVNTQKLIVLLIGPPGCGKGTQAELLSDKLGLNHFEISKIIEEKFRNADPDDLIIKEQRAIWESGDLMDPALIVEWALDGIRNVISDDEGIVTSGTPRTLYEVEAELPEFETLVGKENVIPIEIAISKEASLNRNSRRRICKENRHPIPDFKEFENITVCPKDGSVLIVRKELDDPEVIANRYQVYLRRTVPIIDFLKSHHYAVPVVNGEQSIESVHSDILELIKNR